MANSKYAELSKEELVAEIKDRRNEGRTITVDLRASNDVLIASLEADDAATPEEEQELTREALSTGAAARADGVTARAVPDDLHEYQGQYKYIPTGEVFGLKVLNDSEVRAHKTHHAKSPLKFWDGTEAEFRAQFDKL